MAIVKDWDVSTHRLAGLGPDSLNGTKYQTHYTRRKKYIDI